MLGSYANLVLHVCWVCCTLFFAVELCAFGTNIIPSPSIWIHVLTMRAAAVAQNVLQALCVQLHICRYHAVLCSTQRDNLQYQCCLAHIWATYLATAIVSGDLFA